MSNRPSSSIPRGALPLALSASPRAITRRALLRRLGMAAAALPLARFVRTADAAAAGPPLRLIVWPMLNGADPGQFWPNPGNLAAMSPVTAPLRDFQKQMTFLRGINIEGSFNHFAVRSIFTGAPVSDYLSPDPTVKSLDQVVADQFQTLAPSVRKSLHLGVIPADSIDYYQKFGRSTFFFSQGPIDYDANPVTAFDFVLGNLAKPAAPRRAAVTDPIERQVLGMTEAELDHLAGAVTKSPREAKKVADHKAAIRRLRGDDPGGGGEPTPSPNACDSSALASVEKLRPALEGKPAAAYQYGLFNDIFDAQVDILARSIACGITRVATLQAGSADGNVIVPVGGGLAHHNTSHGDQVLFAQVQAFYAGKLARLLTALKTTTDPLDPSGKSVLDNTCVLWLAECLPQSHGSDGVPCFIAGGAGGKLKTGSYVDFGGASNKALLKTIARAMGVPDAATGHFGATTLSEILV